LNGLALFAGVGGLELGLAAAIGPRYRTVCYVEGETYVASVLVSQMEKGRLHPAPIWSNVRTFDGEPWRGKVDIISAGFPCQPWSKAGSLKKTEDPRWLWPDIERIIREVGPQFVFLENVPGLIDGGLSRVLGSLAALGFDAEWACLKASEVGAPHRRERIFILASEAGGIMAYANSLRQPHKLAPSGNGDSKERRLEGRVAPQRRRTFSDPDGEPILRPSRGECKDSPRLCPNVADATSDRRPQLHDAPEPCELGFITRGDDTGGREAANWWSFEPRVGRVVDGVAHRVDRIRACGNGVVPQQAAYAFRRLLERLGGV